MKGNGKGVKSTPGSHHSTALSLWPSCPFSGSARTLAAADHTAQVPPKATIEQASLSTGALESPSPENLKDFVFSTDFLKSLRCSHARTHVYKLYMPLSQKLRSILLPK